MRRSPLGWLPALLAVLLVACRGGQAPAPPPEEIVNRAVEMMSGAAGFHFSIDRSGAPAFLDANETISFRRADGVYVAPDKARATVRVIVPGIIAEVSMVAVGDRYWETNLLTREWVELPAGQAFNPADLFSAGDGLQAALKTGLTGLTYGGMVELEELPGLPLYQVSGTLDTSQLFGLTSGLIGPGAAPVQVWVHPETFETYRIVITESAGVAELEPTVWQVDFWQFGATESIDPPIP